MAVVGIAHDVLIRGEKFLEEVELYEDEAERRYPNTPACDNADLREAFVRGCLDGYEAVVISPPRGLDRLQQDAYAEGNAFGEAQWDADNPADDDDDDFDELENV